MSAFVFDDCIFSKKLKAECDRQGLVNTQRLQDDLRAEGDQRILPTVVGQGSVLVTEDRKIAEENAECLSRGHPGLVVVASEDSTRTLTDELVRAILRKLKTVFPNWHCITIRNSIVEITQRTVLVWHAAGSKLDYDHHVALDDPRMPEALLGVLSRNASRLGPRTLPDGNQ